MAEISKATRVTQKASDRILAALERARGSLADIPLGVEKLDPRTVKKQAEQTPPGMDTTLSRILYDMRGKYNDPNNGGQ